MTTNGKSLRHIQSHSCWTILSSKLSSLAGLKRGFEVRSSDLSPLWRYFYRFYHSFPAIYYIDVVRAYKGVLKEKEVLEASLKALSIRTTPTRDRSRDQRVKVLNVGTSDGGSRESEGEVTESDDGRGQDEANKGVSIHCSLPVSVKSQGIM